MVTVRKLRRYSAARVLVALGAAFGIFAASCSLFVEVPLLGNGPPFVTDAASEGGPQAPDVDGSADPLRGVPISPTVRKGCDCPGARVVPDAPLAERSRFAVASTWTGQEYLFWGGQSRRQDGHTSHDDGAAYDPVAQTWRMLPPAPISPRSGAVSVWLGSHWLIWGGEDRNADLSPFDDGALYDLRKNRWTKLPKVPAGFGGRTKAAGLAYGTDAWIFGGKTSFGSEDKMLGLRYQLLQDTWVIIPAAPIEGRVPRAFVLRDRSDKTSFGFRGGYECGGDFFAACKNSALFRPDQGLWSATEAIANPPKDGTIMRPTAPCEGDRFVFLVDQLPTSFGVTAGLNEVGSALDAIPIDKPAAAIFAPGSISYGACVQRGLLAFGYHNNSLSGARFEPNEASGTWSSLPTWPRPVKPSQMGINLQVGGDEVFLWGGSSLLGGEPASVIYQP
jgi:hypothetical protein